jgi:hypothetical protein
MILLALSKSFEAPVVILSFPKKISSEARHPNNPATSARI